MKEENKEDEEYTFVINLCPYSFYPVIPTCSFFYLVSDFFQITEVKDKNTAFSKVKKVKQN